MFFIYSIAIHLYTFAIFLASPFNMQAKRWVNGRKNIFHTIQQSIRPGEQIIWLHAASLGEFEQGRPVIEQIKKWCPQYKIVLTFFSPSGYEVRKNYELADYIFYLPADTPVNANRFIRLINPQMVFFIKYEFWFNYLNVLEKKKIPTYIISAIFRPEQHFFKWYGSWFKQRLAVFHHFFVQNEQSATLLKNIGFHNISISGDTRFDRVFEIAQQPKQFELIKQFKGSANLFIAGSTWQPDEVLLSALMPHFLNTKLLIAPHHVNDNHINEIKILFNNHKTLCFSEASEVNIKDADVLIVDSIGILFHLYQYASITYIGGGFGKNIHNILEAATFGNPILFGPNYHKFQEAHDLIALQGAFCIKNQTELIDKTTQLLTHADELQKASFVCKSYIAKNIGATQVILSTIGTKLAWRPLIK